MHWKINEKRLFLALLFISILTGLMMLITFNYMDGQTLMVWSVNNWDLLMEGRFSDFYTDKLLNVRGAVQTWGMGNPFMLIPQMIWDLPLWLTHYFGGNLYVGTDLCVYWYKLFLLGVTIGIAYLVKMIVQEFSADRRRGNLAFLFTFAAPEITLGTMYCGQDEVVYLAFVFMALWSLIKGRKKLFLVAATCAITICPIMILPVGIMLLLYEKRVLIILLNVVINLVPTMAWQIISRNYANRDIALNSSSTISDLMNLILVDTSTGQVSVVAILLLAIVVVAYFYKTDDEHQLGYFTIWMVALVMVIYSFMMERGYYYRLGLYVPFLVTAIFITKDDLTMKTNIFLMALLSYVRFFMDGYECSLNMNTSYVVQSQWMIDLCNRFGSHKYEVYNYVVGKLVENIPILDSLSTVINGFMFILIGIILLLCSEKGMKQVRLDIPEWLSASIYTCCMPLYLFIFYGILFHG